MEKEKIVKAPVTDSSLKGVIRLGHQVSTRLCESRGVRGKAAAVTAAFGIAVTGQASPAMALGTSNAGTMSQNLTNQTLQFIRLLLALAVAAGLGIAIMGFIELKKASSEGGGGRATTSGGWQKVVYGGLCSIVTGVMNLVIGTFLSDGSSSIQGGTASLGG